MKVNEQTKQQLERALRKIANRFSEDKEAIPLTDIHIQVKQESGELVAFDDNDVELFRTIIEEWVGNTSEHFYDDIQPILRHCIGNLKSVTENMNILKPYSFVLVDDDKETITDLYLVDDETMILNEELMKGLSEELDEFWEKLSKD